MDNLQLIVEKLDAISSGIQELKTDVAQLKTDVANLTSRVDRMEKRQEAIFEQTAGLLEFRQATEEMLKDIRDDQLSMSHILGEHEVHIRSLQRRAV